MLNDPAGAVDAEGLLTTNPPYQPPTAPPWAWADPVFRWYNIMNMMPTVDPEAPPPGVDNGGSGGIGLAGPKTTNVPTQAQCLHKVQAEVNSALPAQTVYLGVPQGMAANGMRGGAYNFNFFAPGIAFGSPGPHAVPSRADDPNVCGRFANGLHIPVPGGGCNPSGDPTIQNWGRGVYDGVAGSFLTAHIDSADPYLDVWSFLVHLFENVIAKDKHGC